MSCNMSPSGTQHILLIEVASVRVINLVAWNVSTWSFDGLVWPCDSMGTRCSAACIMVMRVQQAAKAGSACGVMCMWYAVVKVDTLHNFGSAGSCYLCPNDESCWYGRS